MTKLGENTISPLEIEDARDAQFRASELQRGVEDHVREHTDDLANKEREYRKALAVAILKLKAEGFAITACQDLAKGQEHVANLRFARDLARGELEATRQEAYRRGADRRAVDALVDWSRARDLRTDHPPAQYATPIGSGRAAA